MGSYQMIYLSINYRLHSSEEVGVGEDKELSTKVL